MLRAPIFIIEHLEPRLWAWCFIEYKHISHLVGREKVWFTNIKKPSPTLTKYGKILKKSATTLTLKHACVLDPEAPKTLTPFDAKKFDYYLFGGILGNHPPQKRTRQELTSTITAEPRNIGKQQMSTDNAVYVVKQITQGKELKEIPFTDEIEIPITTGESILLPYRYALVNGKPLVCKELINYLKKRQGF